MANPLARRLPRFAGLLFDAAIDYLLWFVVPVAILPADFAVAVFVLALPVAALWEAACFHVFRATPGHWLTGTELEWIDGHRPSTGWLFGRTIRRYSGFLMVGSQPSNEVPAIYALSEARPVRIDRVFAFIDKGRAIVVARSRRPLTRAGVFILSVGLVAACISLASSLDEFSALVGLSAGLGAMAAVVNVSSLWPTKQRPEAAMPEPPRPRKSRRRTISPAG